MIDDVIGSYLDNIEEREFDGPFLALLRAIGFVDIHFLHGSFEFGKDFIAKGSLDGVLCQFAFQTKAGDLGLADWNACRGQIDLLRTNSLAHPAFDPELPREAVFVTTGRLVGGAPLAAQDYSQYLSSTKDTKFVLWDKETLVSMISSRPEIALVGASDGALLELLGQIDGNRIVSSKIECSSRRWFSCEDTTSLYKGVFEAALIAHRLRRRGRLDLACFACLCLIRAAWALAHGTEPPDSHALLVANTGRTMFQHYAAALWTSCCDETLDPLKLIHAHELPSSYVTYPVRCVMLIELLGLSGLLDIEEKGAEGESKARFVAKFFRSQPGASHPISDRWAVSLIPPVLLLGRTGFISEIRNVLKQVIKWVGDHYDSGSLGLSSPYSEPDEEVARLLGSPFEHVSFDRRVESYISTVVLDLAAMLRLGETFELARNDFLAVGALSSVIEVADSRDQYGFGGKEIRFEPNLIYGDTLPQEGWKVSPYHERAPKQYYLQRIGRPWDHLAISAVLRDRHFLYTCLGFLGGSD